MVQSQSANTTQPRQRSRTPAAAEQQFDPWIIWVTVRRCWPWAMPAGIVLAFIAAGFIVYSFEPTYTATHLLEATHDFLAFEDVMPEIEDLAKTERQVILNAVVIEPVLANPQLRAAPSLSDPAYAEKNLRKNLGVSSPGAESQMVVSYVDTDPKAATQVCNAIVESYLAKRNALDNSRITNLAEWLEPEIEVWERTVKLRQRNVQELSKLNQGYDTDQDALIFGEDGALTGLAKLRSEITDLKVQIAVVDRQGSLEQPSAVGPAISQAALPVPEFTFERITPSEAEISNAINADDEVRDAKAQVSYYKAKITQLEDSDLDRINRAHFREMNEKLERWSSELQQAKEKARERVIAILEREADEELERRKAEARNAFAARQAEMSAQRDSAFAMQRADQQRSRAELQARLDALQREYSQQTADEELRRKQRGGAVAELQFAQEELAIATEVLKRLRDRHAAIKTERQRYGAVRTLAAATVPKTPDQSFPWKQVFLGSGVCFAIPFLLGILWEYRVQRLTDIATVEKSGDLAPIIGEVAKLPRGDSEGRHRRVYEESVDSLRANLLMSLDTKDIRSIAVASSMTGEGKSSIASQLAIAIARATGEKVLLIDADVRSPDQHEIFGLELGAGLCGVLAGEVELQEAIDTSLGNLLHVLPAGHLNQSPHRIMNTESILNLLNRVDHEYQHVVIDTAPVLSASETLAVSAAVDATVVCVMRDLSRMENVRRTTRRLEAAGANIVGTVFSGVTASKYAYRYGDYHYAIEVAADS